MASLIDLNAYPVRETLKILLEDKTTKNNIIWATDTYADHTGCKDVEPIQIEHLLGFDGIKLQPRIQKEADEKAERTRKKAEVFTPVWICNQMNNHLDAEWFGGSSPFNEEDGEWWTDNEKRIDFPSGRTWKDYVDSRRLEITCGEAPYLISRYDASTGEIINPLRHRIGLLDRKLRIVNENTDDYDSWLEWTERAFESCYGYEYQGDSLLIARINMIMTFYEYYKERWDTEPAINVLRHFANIISWNIWQMDGVRDAVPLGKLNGEIEEDAQMNLFNLMDPPKVVEVEEQEPELFAPLCRIMDWRSKKPVVFKDLK